MLNKLCLFIALLAPLVSDAANSGRDLSAGIAFPSGNSATFENSALLTEPSEALEVLVGLKDGDLLGSYTGGNSTLGFGFGAQRNGGAFSAIGGLGFRVSTISLGVDAEYNFDTSSLTLDAGFAASVGSNMRFALTVTDLTGGADSLTVGLGYKGNPFLLEADLRYDISPKTLTLLPALMVQAAGDSLSFLFGLSIPLSGGNTDVRIGVSYWFTSNFMLEYLYQVFLETHVLGLKFKL